MEHFTFKWSLLAMISVFFVGGIAMIIGFSALYVSFVSNKPAQTISVEDDVFLETLLAWENSSLTYDGYRKNLKYSFDIELSIFSMMIVIGVCLVILGAIGFLTRKVSGPMFTFAYLNFILLLIASLSKVYNNREYLVLRTMKNSIKSYTGVDGVIDSAFNNWNVFMIKNECCGTIDYSDFTRLENWQRGLKDYNMTRIYNIAERLFVSSDRVTNPSNELIWQDFASFYKEFVNYLQKKGCHIDDSTQLAKCDWMRGDNVITPVACCKHLYDVFNGCHLSGTANQSNNNMYNGCAKVVYKKLSDLDDNLVIVHFIVSAFLCIYLALIVSQVILKQIEESEENLVPLSLTNIDSEGVLSLAAQGAKLKKISVYGTKKSVDVNKTIRNKKISTAQAGRRLVSRGTQTDPQSKNLSVKSIGSVGSALRKRLTKLKGKTSEKVDDTRSVDEEAPEVGTIELQGRYSDTREVQQNTEMEVESVESSIETVEKSRSNIKMENT